MVENKASFSMRQGIAAVVFLALALGLALVTPSIEIAWVTCILVLTIYLFAFEVVSVDVAAVSIMVLLGLSSLLAPTSTVSPSIEIAAPKLSESVPSDTLSLACCVQVVPVRVKTYTEPELVATSSLPGALTIAVLPEIETVKPKLSKRVYTRA